MPLRLKVKMRIKNCVGKKQSKTSGGGVHQRTNLLIIIRTFPAYFSKGVFEGKLFQVQNIS